jgi:hypothetical protein
MKKLLIALTFLTLSISAFAKDCRQAVVDASVQLREPMSADEFSSRTFEDYNLTAREFNALSSKEQIEIYKQVKPLEVAVEEMIARVNRTINYLYNDIYTRIMNPDLIDGFRDTRDELRACN